LIAERGRASHAIEQWWAIDEMLVEAANTLADSFRKATTLTYQFPLATAGG
jgi:hypothetical protein